MEAALRLGLLMCLLTALVAGEGAAYPDTMFDPADDAMSMGGSDAQLGETKEDVDFPVKKEKKDKEGKEPGDGSDPPAGGAEEEKKQDDPKADSEAPQEEENPPDINNLLGKIATQKPSGPLVPKTEGEYVHIPNFMFQGTPENVKNREECQKKCNEQKECRSYSWNEKEKMCGWSTGSLRYGHFWNFYSKEYDLNAFGKLEPTKEYFRFKGLFAIDEDQNMKTLEDKSVEDCKEICNEDDKCSSFSFHEGDNACLMGVSKVEYMKGWDYYERNRSPREPGGEWRTYAPRLDSYHAELRKREKDSLKIFAERDKKIRKKKEVKEQKVKKVTKATDARKRRLDKEMKVKEFASEQRRKQARLAQKQKKVDLAAAKARGTFDEAFHKQNEINKELLHKKNMETSVKSSMIERVHEKDHKENKKLQKRLADIKDRSMKELAQKRKETESKERLQKAHRKARAVDMKREAFALVKEERKYKSYQGYTYQKKKSTKAAENILHKQWIAEDANTKYLGQEKEVKRQIEVEKQTHEVNRKLIKEKEEKGPPPDGAKKEDTPDKTKLPPAPPSAKAPRVPGSTPGGPKTSPAV